jgi:hypothetical protein
MINNKYLTLIFVVEGLVIPNALFVIAVVLRLKFELKKAESCRKYIPVLSKSFLLVILL